MNKLRMAIKQAINKQWPPKIIYGDGAQDDTDALKALFHGRRVRYVNGDAASTTLKAGYYRVTQDIDIGKRVGY